MLINVSCQFVNLFVYFDFVETRTSKVCQHNSVRSFHCRVDPHIFLVCGTAQGTLSIAKKKLKFSAKLAIFFINQLSLS